MLRCTSFERRHRLARSGGATREVVRELAALGLTGLHVPAEHGGLGLGPVEAMLVMEELGRGLVNAPYAAAALMTPALLANAACAGQATPLLADWLPRIADGSALVVPALQEPGARYRHDVCATVALQEAEGWTLTGRKSLVPAGDEADAFLVPARVGAQTDAPIGLFLVERDRCSVRGFPTQDGARAAEVSFQGATAHCVLSDPSDGSNAIDASAAIARANDVGIAASCAEGVGAMDALLRLTVDYMNTRKQFGQPLAGFQALRHRIADVKMQLELARSMSYFATLQLGEAPAQRRHALSQAKLQLGQSMRFVGQQCIQLHGGIGMTDEYAASHYFKRLTMLELAHGDSLHHLGQVSAGMQDTAGVFS
ncbi:MAG: acyl-CoA dehydrogenase family protein [Burkholderiaceae bacterium]